ncbi:hypothetical protein DMENIID0001_020200 [Sergentomyia squamirostris]
MSGLFRYNSTSTTPQRRTPMRSFRTTPSQLQDVTMDNSVSFGVRSPSFSVCGQGSPGQAKSLRDYEDQITTFQRENFNLKLRIYFLEEKLNGSAMGQGTESLFKQNVDLKVEIEAQKKELQEKDELLTQAANAMKYMEDVQKMLKEEAKATENELKSRIDLLELEISEMQKVYGPSANSTNLISLVEGDGVGCRSSFGFTSEAEVNSRNLQETLDQVNQMNEQMKESMEQLESQHREKGHKIKELEYKTENLTRENSQLKEKVENLEQTAKMTEELKGQLFELREQLAEKMCDQQDLEAQLREKTQNYENSCAAIQKLLITIKESKEGDQRSQLGRNHAENEDLVQLLKAQLENKDLEVTNLRAEVLRTVEQKNAEIYDLKTEVKRKTTNLQRLINKDLWDKNREIERLTRLESERNGSSENPVKLNNVEQLQSHFTEVQYNEAIERNVQLNKKLDTLRQTLCFNSNDTECRDLRRKLEEAQADADSANRWRKECAEVCSMLTLRLEELAGFLDSLLKHKDILGALCADRRHAMRRAIDRSLDLSRSINNSSLNLGLSFSEQSLMQMSGLSGILDDSFTESVAGTRENVDSGKIIEALRAEVTSLRTELEKCYKCKEKRSNEPDGGHSESESWSEPDRNVSAARIGLEDRKVRQSKPYNSSTDEDDTSVTPMKKTLVADKISQLESLVTEKENKLLEVQMSFVERENAMKEERFRLSDQLQVVERDLTAQLEINRKLTDEIVELKSHLTRDCDLREEIAELKSDLVEKCENINALTKERDATAVNLRVAELKMETMVKDMEYVREKHLKDVAFRLEKARKEFDLEHEAQLQRQELEHRETLTRDYVTKVMFSQKCEEVDVLRRRLTDAQATVDAMSEAEIELRALLAEHEKKAREMQKSLNDATIQASRAALERSRAVSERGQAVATVKDLQGRYDSLMMEKADLNGRIGELENLTATLQNQLVKVTVKNESRERSSDDGERLNNSSPDLGIDSDVARASSSDAVIKKPIRLNASMIPLDSTGILPEHHDCVKIMEENVELKRRVVRTRRQLEETVRRLKQSNKQKEQIEHDIQMQILKTHNVLKQVRSNMETEAEKRNISLPPHPSGGSN